MNERMLNTQGSPSASAPAHEEAHTAVQRPVVREGLNGNESFVALRALKDSVLEAHCDSIERVKDIKGNISAHYLGAKAVGREVVSEYKSGSATEKLASGSLIAATIGTQIVDRARVVIITAPPAAVAVLESTNSPVAAAATAAGIFATWNGSVGEVLTQTMAKFPRSMRKFRQEFPSVLNVFSDSLAGIREQTEDNPRKNHHPDSIQAEKSFTTKIKEALNPQLRTRRALQGMSLGSTAFVATASTNGEKKRDVRKHNIGVTTDTSALIFGVVLGVAEAIHHLGKSNPELVQNIQDVAGDARLWLGLAGLSIISEFRSNRKKRKEQSALEDKKLLALSR